MMEKIKKVFIKNKEGINDFPVQDGFLKLIIIIVVALLLMRYFHITISGILAYFHLTWPDVINWLNKSINWLKDLFNSVK